MNKAVGLALLVVGVVLLIFGISAADAPASDISRFFTGQPTDRSMWFMLGGVALIIIGGVGTFLGGRAAKSA
ncbi:MAG: DUF3185 family protein [Planctomycetota bacterium]